MRDVVDLLAKDPRLSSLDDAGRPAFVVDGAGALVWAGLNARRLLGEGGLDAASARTLARVAATGAAGMVRLRIGAPGEALPVSFQARRIEANGDEALLALEGVSPIDAALIAPPHRAAEPVEPQAAEAASARDVAGEEGAHVSRHVAGPVPLASEPPVAGQPAADFDTPPDPRRDVVPTVASEPSPPARPAGIEPFRFVFEFDRDDRLTFLSPDLKAVVGATAAGLEGLSWDEIADRLGLDPDQAVADALGSRAGWRDLDVVWPAEDGRRVRLALSALPMFDRERVFAGFRGLGRFDGLVEPSPSGGPPADDVAEPGPAVIHDEADASADGAIARGHPAIAPSETPASASVVESDPAKLERPAEPPAIVSTPLPLEVLGRNVVPLREQSPPLAVALSSSEEDAFDEIARRLGVLSAPFGGQNAPETAEIVAAPTASAWTIDDVEGRAPTASRLEDLLRLLDRLPVGALVMRAGEIDYANRAALELLGARDLTTLRAHGAEALFGEPPPRDDAAPTTTRLVALDGVEIEAEARLSTLSWRGGPATLVSLKRAEGSVAAAQAATEREREAAAILDVASDGVVTLDGAGRILSANRGAQRLFGFDAREAVGALFTLSLAPESRRAAFDCLDEAKAGGSPTSQGREVLGLLRRGGSAPLYMTVGRVGAPEQHRYCAVLRDITPWKKAEEELLAARRQAERANAQKSEFLAKVSHEIRTPLNAIIGFSEVMIEERFGPIGSPRYKDYLRDIHASGGHVIGLVNDLLDLTRIESGGAKLDLSPVDLNEIVQQAAALLQPQANRDHVIIRTSLARGLPPVLADRRSVRQIMTNLASNAVRLSRPGGQVIVATALTEVGQAVIRVRDAGLGMTKQELSRALEPFRPLGAADNDAGAALCLPLTKALAEANEAVFALESQLGHGTLAEVTFPASRVLAS